MNQTTTPTSTPLQLDTKTSSDFIPGGELYITSLINYLGGPPDFEIRVSNPGDILSYAPIYYGHGEIQICTAPQDAEKAPERVLKRDMTNVVNINTADAAELMTLNGIGAVKAQSIINYRVENGSFAEPQDIMKVKGIGQATFSKNINRITTK